MEEMGEKPVASMGDGGETGRHEKTPGKSIDDLDLNPFIDRTPLAIMSTAQMEYLVEIFGKLGLRYMVVTE